MAHGAIKVVARDDVGPIYHALPWVDEFQRVRTLLDYTRSLSAGDADVGELRLPAASAGLIWSTTAPGRSAWVSQRALSRCCQPIMQNYANPGT